MYIIVIISISVRIVIKHSVSSKSQSLSIVEAEHTVQENSTNWRRGFFLAEIMANNTIGNMNAFDAAKEKWSAYTERFEHYHVRKRDRHKRRKKTCVSVSGNCGEQHLRFAEESGGPEKTRRIQIQRTGRCSTAAL